jgi:hypothetical protein
MGTWCHGTSTVPTASASITQFFTILSDDAHGLGGCEGQDGQGEGNRHPFALGR